MIRAPQLYTFLEYCNDSPLEKEILECGAGVSDPSVEPLLVTFHRHGYVTHGIDTSDKRVAAARDYCESQGLDVDIRKGDMRQLMFEDESMSFVFSYETIFHMTKADVGVALGEIERVLKPGGLCFVNVLSVENETYGKGEQIGKGEYVRKRGSGQVVLAHYEDDEADQYFGGFEILHKEKRVREWLAGGERRVQAFVDYIARKKERGE